MTNGAVICALAENLSSKLADKLLQEATLVTGFKEDFEILCDEIVSIKCLLTNAGEKINSSSMSYWLDKLECFLYDAADVVNECGVPAKFGNPIFRYMMGRKIRELKDTISEIHRSAKYLQYLKSIHDVSAYNANNSEDTRERSSAHLTEIHSVGMEQDITKVTELLLKEDGNQVIGVVGMAGLGKTFLVQHVFRSEDVQKHFTHRVWLTVSQNFVVEELLVEMGRQIHLDDAELLGNQVRSKIHEKLNGSRCLFVLDDVWHIDALEKIGLPLQKKSKIMVTTRAIGAVEGMKGNSVHTMSNLTQKNRIKLFCIHAFPERACESPPEELEDVVNKIVKKCGGLPLALKTIGASMRRVRRLPNDWESICNRLNETEAMTGQVMSSLRLSYHALPYHLKLCFLYCSLFPKSTEICADYIVHEWIGEGFIPETANDTYDIGYSYVNELVDRCLVEVSWVDGNGRVKYFKIHDLFHDLALSEFHKQTKCLINLEMEVKEFPVDECLALRRISLIKTQISAINDEINSPCLRTLLLWNNKNLAQISSKIFSKMKYLAVLDLSETSMDVLPETVGNLKHLKILNLSRTKLKKLPKSLADLPSLQYLDVSECKDLSELHSGIGEHQSILHLNLKDCKILEWLPRGVTKLIYLQKLKGIVFKEEKAANPTGFQLRSLFMREKAANAGALQLRDLEGLTRLRYLSLTLHASSSGGTIQLEGIFAGMTNMRTLSFEYISHGSTDDSSNPLQLPKDIEVMKRLEELHLSGCLLPKWVFKLKNLVYLKLHGDNGSTADYKGLEKIPNLTRLTLSNNGTCTDIPEEFGERGAFPKLERLIIQDFRCLKSFPARHPEAMPKLKDLKIINCKQLLEAVPELKDLPITNYKQLKETLSTLSRSSSNLPT